MATGKDFGNIIAETLVMMAAADGQVLKKEQQMVASALKDIWDPGYGGMKSALVHAFTEIKLATDFGMNLQKKIESHALTISRVFSNREKVILINKMDEIMRVDGESEQSEVALFLIFKKNVTRDAGLMSTLKGMFGK